MYGRPDLTFLTCVSLIIVSGLDSTYELPRGLSFHYMVIRCKRNPFFGNMIGADGIEPDPEKVTAICNMTAPTGVRELQTFLRLANYLGRFTPHLATAPVPLGHLCKTNVPYD